MVVNAPTSNIVSAAELAIALLLATARHVSAAHAALRGGQWKRSAYTGVELYEKTLGVVGLGRIGVLVAQRMAAFGMDVIAYDPYISTARAGQLGVRLTGLDELLATSDFVTVHLPRTPETIGLIGDAHLRRVKPGLRIVNAARGGIVDEDALYAALKEGRVAGAGLDVYRSEPCTDSPLFELDTVVATPHLGASTHEAQERAGIAVARSVRLALAGELVPDAVNVSGGSGGVIAQDVRPGIALSEKLGRIFTALAAGRPTQLDVEVRGEITSHDVGILRLAVLKGLFEGVVSGQVSYVNAPVLAAERNIQSRLLTDPDSPQYQNVVTVRGTLPEGTQLAVSGTVTGPKRIEKLVGIDGYDLEVALAAHMLVLRYTDRPGVIGTVGRLLGDSGTNIASMQVGRTDAGGAAVSVLTLDEGPGQAVLDEIAAEIGAESVRLITLD
jgi:D-3-phosphoglycerate dehydrogenase